MSNFKNGSCVVTVEAFAGKAGNPAKEGTIILKATSGSAPSKGSILSKALAVSKNLVVGKSYFMSWVQRPDSQNEDGDNFISVDWSVIFPIERFTDAIEARRECGSAVSTVEIELLTAIEDRQTV